MKKFNTIEKDILYITESVMKKNLDFHFQTQTGPKSDITISLFLVWIGVLSETIFFELFVVLKTNLVVVKSKFA